MRIAEISSPSLSQSQPQSQTQIQSEHHNRLLSQIESFVKQAELLSSSDKPFPHTISGDLRNCLTLLSQLVPFPNSLKLHLWKLSYRLWNACVDLSNISSVHRFSNEHASLRHVASDLLFLAGFVAGVPSPSIKSASFYYKTGLIWHDLRNFELASTCFERASDLISKIDPRTVSDAGERKLLLDLNIARSRTAWEVTERNLSLALLSRAKSLLFGLPEHYKALGNQYLAFGKSELSNKETPALNEALKLINEALDLYEKGLRVAKSREETLDFKVLRSKALRFIAAVNLQIGEFESTIKCVGVLREGESEVQHVSLPVLAMKAWLGLGRFAEAEKELKGMVVSKDIPEGVWLSAVEAYFEAAGAAGAETVKGVFMGLLGRLHVSAGAAVRVAHRVVGDGGEASKLRSIVVAELVSDERVVALFNEEAAAKHRKAMHAVLWNCAADHFQSKDYKTSAEMFEKSMLYIPYDIESRILRAKGFRVLCLCYLGLSLLDQAQEYITEAEKLEPNIACAFLKFKIYLQKNDHSGATNQIQAMMTCLDFTPDFLSLSAHEAVACRAFPVAVTSLSYLLDFCVPGKTTPTTEVVVLRTLVTILIQESGNEKEILKFIKRACDRASELGPDCFFGKGEVGKREHNWFAVTSWNFGTRMGRERKYDLCTEFLRLASEFYGALVDGQVEENSIMVCKSLTLAVSAMIASEDQTKATLSTAKVKEAKELLVRAGKILMSISIDNQLDKDLTDSPEAELFFIYALSAYNIHGRLNDAGSQQLLIKSFVSSKFCSPKHLLRIALSTSQGPRFNPKASKIALNECLSALLSSPSPEYQNVAIIVRKLVAVISVNYGETDDDAVYGMYKQAFRIMVGLKEGEYPSEEGKWLAMTAWNRAAMPVRLGQIYLAKKWLDVGLELARHVAGMETYRECMEEFVNTFQNKFPVNKG